MWTTRPPSTPDVAESNPSSQVTAAWVTHKSPGLPADEPHCDGLLCSQSAAIKVSITLMSGPLGGYKLQKEAGAKQKKERKKKEGERDSSCSNFTYWPMAGGGSKAEQSGKLHISSLIFSRDPKITRHPTLCVAYGRNKWNLLTWRTCQRR